MTAHSDRKSTRLNSSHPSISYAVFCLKKKKQKVFQRDNDRKKDSDGTPHLDDLEVAVKLSTESRPQPLSESFARFIDVYFFFFNDTATTEIYTLSLHDALPILAVHRRRRDRHGRAPTGLDVNAA